MIWGMIRAIKSNKQMCSYVSQKGKILYKKLIRLWVLCRWEENITVSVFPVNKLYLVFNRYSIHIFKQICSISKCMNKGTNIKVILLNILTIEQGKKFDLLTSPWVIRKIWNKYALFQVFKWSIMGHIYVNVYT